MFDSFRSSKRPDLSGIHPLKRVILIGLLFLFGTSTAMAIGMQFVWVDGYVFSPPYVFAVIGTDIGLGVCAEELPVPAGLLSQESGLEWHRYTEPPEYSFLFHRHGLLPGVWIRVDNMASGTFLYSFSTHHAWLTTFSGAAYLLARWRIRRSALRQLLRGA